MNTLAKVHPVHSMSLREFSNYCTNHAPRSILYNAGDELSKIDPTKVLPPRISVWFSSIHFDTVLRAIHLKGDNGQISFREVSSVSIVDIGDISTSIRVRCSSGKSFAIHALTFL